MTFRSKIDRRMIIFAAAFSALILALSALFLQSKAAVVVFPLAALLLALVSWVFLGTKYAFLEDCLLVRSGPYARRIPYTRISSVKPSKDISSAPALSLDRLALTVSNGKYVTDVILVSPEDKESFLRELKKRCPQV